MTSKIQLFQTKQRIDNFLELEENGKLLIPCLVVSSSEVLYKLTSKIFHKNEGNRTWKQKSSNKIQKIAIIPGFNNPTLLSLQLDYHPVPNAQIVSRKRNRSYCKFKQYRLH